MPALSPTMTHGNLAKWLVKKGDQIKAGDLIAEIETDKATMEIEAVEEGIVKELLFKEGEESIEVNAPIAIVDIIGNKSIQSQKVQGDKDNSKNILKHHIEQKKIKKKN